MVFKGNTLVSGCWVVLAEKCVICGARHKHEAFTRQTFFISCVVHTHGRGWYGVRGIKYYSWSSERSHISVACLALEFATTLDGSQRT